jgi:hypothetical protein
MFYSTARSAAMSVLVGSSSRAAISGDRPGAVKAFAKSSAHRVVPSIQPSVFQASEESGSSLVAANASALRAPAESRVEQRRGTAQAMHGLARIRHQRFVGLQRALEIPIARSAMPIWSKAMS